MNVAKTKNSPIRTFWGVFTVALTGIFLAASCTSENKNARALRPDPLPSEIVLATLNGTSINLANRVTEDGHLVFTILDTSRQFFSLCSYNLLNNATRTLGKIPAHHPRYSRSQRAIIDVVVNDHQIMLLSEMQWHGGDGGNHSDFLVQLFDMNANLIEERELRGSGETSSSIRSPFPSWLSRSGLPAIYLQGSGYGSALPSMVCDIGKDRYEFNVQQTSQALAAFDLQISRTPFDTVSIRPLEYERGVRPPKSLLYRKKLPDEINYSGSILTGLGKLQLQGTGWSHHPQSWVGSNNAVMIDSSIYFMLNDVVLKLRNGQVHRVTTVGLSETERIEGGWYSRFIDIDNIWKGHNGQGKDRIGIDGSTYRKLYADGALLYAAIDNRKLFVLDTRSNKGQTIRTDTTAAWSPVAEYFINENSIWEVWTPSGSEDIFGRFGALVHLNNRGDIQSRYRVAFDAWDRTDAGEVQVLALENSDGRTVTLCLLESISESDFSTHGDSEMLENDDAYWDPEDDFDMDMQMDSSISLPNTSQSLEMDGGHGDQTVMDIDGNVYRVSQIGVQFWMTANLRTSRYRNGALIPNVTDAGDWPYAETGAWCNYGNQPNLDVTYGKLYNARAAMNQNICPKGWHVPSDEEWRLLEIELGMPPEKERHETRVRGREQNVGGKMKANTHWHHNKNGTSNGSGFTGLPGGWRTSGDGSYHEISILGKWWSTTKVDANYVWGRYLEQYDSGITRSPEHMSNGLCIRCIRD